MAQYPNNYQQNTSCNTENCKRCRNKYSCSQYIDYLENTVQTSVNSNLSAPPLESQPNIQTMASLKNSLVEIVVNKFLVLETRYKILQEVNEGLVNTISEMSEILSEIDKKFAKLDRITSLVDAYDTCGNSEAGGVSVYNGKAGGKVLVEKKSKGILGIGSKTEWVEEDIT